MKVVNFANLTFSGLSKKHIFNIKDSIKVIVPTNAEIIVKANEDEYFKNIISKFILTFDGEIPFRLAKHKSQVQIDKLSGSDLIYDFCNMAQDKGWKIFLLGGNADSNKKSVSVLSNRFQISIEGYSPPYCAYPFPKEHNELIRYRIEKFNPSVLFVGFGVPKQEYWINDNIDFLKQIGIKYVVACGGTYEMVAGQRNRAPKFIQKLGVESLYRLIIEPKAYRLKRFLNSFKMFRYV